MGKVGKISRLGSVVSFLVVFLILGQALEAHASPKPFVSKAIPDAAREILFVHGANFGKDPAVWLDGIRLHALFSSDTRIHAELPSLEAGTYLLIVLRAGRHASMIDDLATMDVTLGAVGPEGPAGPQGPEGPPGDRGEAGAPGRDGSQWFTGDGPPTSSIGKPGDLYLDQISGDVYRKDADWSRVASLLGSEGPPGPPGAGSDPREELAALLGIDAFEVSVPPDAVTEAQCQSGAFVTLAGSGGGEVVGLFGGEAISSPFRFLVAVRSATSDPPAPVGSDVSLTIANLSTTTVPGIVTSADYGGTIGNDSIHVLTVEPALVRARSFRGFAVFEQQTAPEIVDLLLNGFNVQPTFLLTGAETRIEHESQWDETSLDFVRRLLEREGFHFHLTEDGRMIVGNANGVFGIGPSLPYQGHFADPGTSESVSSFRVGDSASPAHVTVRGWDVRRKETVTGEAMAQGFGEIFTYRADADRPEIARNRAEALLGSERASAVLRSGTSNSPGVRAGKLVTIGGAGSPFNGSYVVTGVRHVLRKTESCFAYGNAFTAIPSAVTFRPERKTPVPRFPGTVTAVVTNNNDPSGLYRVKVRFPWLPSSESGWARVAVPLVGAGFALPEVDDEVLVAFENGDISRPMVIGTLWNGVDRPPTSP